MGDKIPDEILKRAEKDAERQRQLNATGFVSTGDFVSVRNVQGSTAGAGSGEFHIYRMARRKEITRLARMEYEHQQQIKDEEFRKKREAVEKELADKAAKRKAKRQKMKEKAKKKGKGTKSDGTDSHSSAPNSPAGNSADEGESAAPKSEANGDPVKK